MIVRPEFLMDGKNDIPLPKKRHKRKRLLFPVLILVLGLTVTGGGIWAYMTATDDTVNKFTIGDVHISAKEPNMPTEDEDGDGVPDECELLVPLEEIPKDPVITNTGTNDCIVFFRVTVPVEELNLIGDDGRRGDKAPADIFWMKQKEDPAGFHQNHFDENWIELGELDHEFVHCDGINNEGNGYTYIFGYHVRLKNGDTTTALFDKIQNKKYGSRTISANETEQIKLETFAIQAENIYQAGINIDTSGTLDEQTLTHIYKVFINQNVDEAGGKTW